MGCASSGMFRKRPQDVMLSPHILDTYIHLEKEIVREEQTAPAPALSHTLGRLDDLAIDLEAAQQRLSRFTRTPSGARDESLREVLIDLGVEKSPDVAAEHEEFIANINRQVLAQNEVDILSRRLEEAEEEVKMLTSKVNFLQGLYQQQDTLLGELFGEAYGSQEEKKLEDELDRLRSYRDTLAGGALDWREASSCVQGAVELLDRAVQVCKQLASQNAESRFHLATEARNCLQEAALGVQMAQALLPGVQFPYCSAREITTVLQVDQHSTLGK
ncbi:unnamed protein product [Timema podura]|uniref:Uncharacterized protein n=1 Tax=Timema podura TaxID=61482 RepID=A0ABN7NIX8_TIMPD|nr:unnamed protein product [Timema podura]